MIRELLERAAVRPSKVETLKNGAVVLRGVKYLGARSMNVNSDGSSNVYPLETRRASERLYEGASIYTDHPERSKPHAERKLGEKIGRLRGPFVHKADGSYADLVLNPKHPLTEAVAWSARHSPDDLGLSHNAQGAGSVKGKDAVIESIKRVRSVDLVTQGATTSSLFESRREPPSRQPRASTPKERFFELAEAALAHPAVDARTIREVKKLLDEAKALLSQEHAGRTGNSSAANSEPAADVGESRRPLSSDDALYLIESGRLPDHEGKEALFNRL